MISRISSSPPHLPRLFLTAALGFLSVFPAGAEEWPGFRGPSGMGLTSEKGLPLKWGGPDAENIVWKVPLPATRNRGEPDHNQSSPVLVGGRVFVTTAKDRRRLDEFGEFDPSFLPPPPQRGLIAVVFSRGLIRDGNGGLRIYKTKAARSFEPGRDHFWLTGAEARSLVSGKAWPGARKAVAPAIIDRICRRYLIDLVRVGGNGGPRRKEEVGQAEMSATVESSTDHEIRIRFAGSARLATHDIGSGAAKDAPKIDQLELLGFATFDQRKQQFTAFHLLAFSETGHYDEISKKFLPLGVAFKLSSGKTPADRVPPSSYSADYFKSKP